MQTEKTDLTCPDCHGPLHRVTYGTLTEFKCRIGHTYSSQSALAAHYESEERILGSAIESLEEGADLAQRVTGSVPQETGNDLRAKSMARRVLAKRIRALVENE